jgi:hypothetical protein
MPPERSSWFIRAAILIRAPRNHGSHATSIARNCRLRGWLSARDGIKFSPRPPPADRTPRQASTGRIVHRRGALRSRWVLHCVPSGQAANMFERPAVVALQRCQKGWPEAPRSIPFAPGGCRAATADRPFRRARSSAFPPLRRAVTVGPHVGAWYTFRHEHAPSPTVHDTIWGAADRGCARIVGRSGT